MKAALKVVGGSSSRRGSSASQQQQHGGKTLKQIEEEFEGKKGIDLEDAPGASNPNPSSLGLDSISAASTDTANMEGDGKKSPPWKTMVTERRFDRLNELCNYTVNICGILFMQQASTAASSFSSLFICVQKMRFQGWPSGYFWLEASQLARCHPLCCKSSLARGVLANERTFSSTVAQLLFPAPFSTPPWRLASSCS